MGLVDEFVGIASLWWNWTAAYTQDNVKPLFDKIKSYFINKQSE